MPSPFTRSLSGLLVVSIATLAPLLAAEPARPLPLLPRAGATHPTSIESPATSDERPTRGARNAAVTIVFFDDPQCPHSALAYRTLFDEVLTEYSDRVRVLVKEVPNKTIHPWATRAAINASCLARQSAPAYWDFVDYVHAHQSEIDADAVAALDTNALRAARAHNVAGPSLQACLQTQPDSRVREAFRDARAMGVTALPTLFVGSEKVEGAVPGTVIREALERALRTPHSAIPPPKR